MDDLIAFLEARWVEMLGGPHIDIHTVNCGYTQIEFMADCDCPLPAYVLADIAGKRQIVELHGFTDGGWNPGEDLRCTECGWIELAAGVGQRGAQRQWPCRTVRLLALPFADHPDYQARWAL